MPKPEASSRVLIDQALEKSDWDLSAAAAAA